MIKTIKNVEYKTLPQLALELGIDIRTIKKLDKQVKPLKFGNGWRLYNKEKEKKVYEFLFIPFKE